MSSEAVSEGCVEPFEVLVASGDCPAHWLGEDVEHRVALRKHPALDLARVAHLDSYLTLVFHQFIIEPIESMLHGPAVNDAMQQLLLLYFQLLEFSQLLTLLRSFLDVRSVVSL